MGIIHDLTGVVNGFFQKIWIRFSFYIGGGELFCRMAVSLKDLDRDAGQITGGVRTGHFVQHSLFVTECTGAELVLSKKITQQAESRGSVVVIPSQIGDRIGASRLDMAGMSHWFIHHLGKEMRIATPLFLGQKGSGNHSAIGMTSVQLVTIAIADVAAQSSKNLVVFVGVDGGTDDQIFRGLLFQTYTADVCNHLRLAAQFHQAQFIVNDLLNPVQLLKFLLDFLLLLGQKLLECFGAAMLDIAADLLEGHSDFLQTANGKKQVTLIFAVIAVAIVIGEGRPEQTDLVVIEQGSLVGIA